MPNRFSVFIFRFILVNSILFLSMNIGFGSNNMIFAEVESDNVQQIIDLIIESGETYVIQDKDVILSGDITIEPNAKLIINNSNIFSNSSFWMEHKIIVQDNALLQINNSNLSNQISNSASTIRYYGTVEIFNSIVDWVVTSFEGSCIITNSSINRFEWYGRTKLVISNSELTVFEFNFHNIKNEDVQIQNIKRNISITTTINCSQDDFVIFENSIIYYWHANLRPDYTKQVTIEESQIQWLGLGFPNEVNIVDFDYTKENFTENDFGSPPWKLKFINSEITNHLFLQLGKSSSISNSIIGVETSENVDRSIIKNSSLTVTRFVGLDTKIENCEIVGSFYIGHYPAYRVPESAIQKITFSDSKFGRDLIIIEQNCFLKGNVTFQLSEDKIRFVNGFCIREYPVRIQDENGRPLAGVSLRLIPPNGGTSWIGSTNSYGFSKFNITFNGLNYRDDWRLEVDYRDITLSYDVSVLTNTPIIETFSTHQLNVISDHGTVSGERFYLDNAIATLSVSPLVVEIDENTKMIFSGWKSNSSLGYSGPENPVEITMNEDITQTAIWKTQYYLTFESGTGGNISPESGWFDEGTKLTISAIPDAGAVFDSWMGTRESVPSGSSLSFPFTVTQPIQATAVFRIEDNPPEVEITEGPKATVTDRKQTFMWEGSDDVSNSDALHYQYKLEGYDDEWSAWTSLTSKTYNPITPGEYTFLVKARDEAGIISEVKEKSFTVSLVSTITIWGRTIPTSYLGLSLTIITLGGIVIGLVRSVYLNVLKQKRAEDLFRHRMSEILKAKGDLDELNELSDNITSDYFVNRILNKTQFEQLDNQIEEYITKLKKKPEQEK